MVQLIYWIVLHHSWYQRHPEKRMGIPNSEWILRSSQLFAGFQAIANAVFLQLQYVIMLIYKSEIFKHQDICVTLQQDIKWLNFLN